MKRLLSILRYLLFPFAILYAMVISIRHFLYDLNIFKSKSFGTPSICVGNIAMGGTGKTPHIEYLIRLLNKSKKLATLSRGYKRKTEGFVLANDNHTSEDIGDEPKQIKQQFPNISVSVDVDRCYGVSQLESLENSPDVILLDDAFQHRRIKAGMNMVLTDYKHPYWKDYVFPVGNLRDVRFRIQKADIIVITKCPKSLSLVKQQAMIKKIKPHAKQNVFFSAIYYGELIPLSNNKLEFNHSETVVLMLTGIANPSHLNEHLSFQFKDVKTLNFSDHHHFTQSDFDKIIERYNRIRSEHKIIVTTLKDVVRLKDNINFAKLVELPLYYQSMEIKFISKKEQDKFDKLIIDYVERTKRNG